MCSRAIGANKLVGSVLPLPGSGLESPLSFSVKFNAGGCGTFLQLFFPLLAYSRASITNPPPPAAQGTLSCSVNTFLNSSTGVFRMAHEGNISNTAFVDPNDPSVVYVAQPTFAEMPPPSAPPVGVVSDEATAASIAMPVGRPVQHERYMDDPSTQPSAPPLTAYSYAL